MDFIKGLPHIHGRNAIFMVVNRLSKYAHFIAIKHPYSAAKVAVVFLREVFCLYGMPMTIVVIETLSSSTPFGSPFSSSTVPSFAATRHTTPNPMAKPKS